MDQSNEDFILFLRGRNILEPIIQKLQEDKIDPQVIKIMDEADLLQYFKYGDMLAVLEFCGARRHHNRNAPKRKMTLLESFKAKLNSKNPTSSAATSNSSCSSTATSDSLNTIHTSLSTPMFPECSTIKPKLCNEKKEHGSLAKDTRKIFLGLLMVESSGTKRQIRQNKGGGTRQLMVKKTDTKQELQVLAESLYFPNQHSSSLGDLEKYTRTICNFQMHEMESNVSVGELYSMTKLSHLRFYLQLELKAESVEDNLKDIDGDNVIVSDNEYSFTFNNMNDSFDDDNLIVARPTEQNMNTPPQNNSVPALSTNSNIVNRLVLHRGQIFKEMMSAFKDVPLNDQKIGVTLILPNGEEEKAIDVGGVFRDSLTEFWTTFFETCTLGTTYKIPFLQHGFQEEEWQSIGKILVKGWLAERYFPIRLAPAFVEKCMFNSHTNILESFKLYVSDSEKKLIEQCLQSFDEVQTDELEEFLEDHGCRSVVNSTNISQILEEIAHKELIQTPQFVINCWSMFMSNMTTKEDLAMMYKNMDPSAKNILKILTTFANTPDQEKVFGFLKKYVRESEPFLRKAFLRFCTGSDVVIGKNIEVTYNTIEGIERNPVSHVCSCNLELSISYKSFPEFRSEFNCVLQSGIWAMEIA